MKGKSLVSAIVDSKIYFILFLLMVIGSSYIIINYDKAFFLELLDKHRTPFLNKAFIQITKIGEYYTFVFFFFYFLYKKSRVSFSILFLGAVMPLISYFLKQYFKHPRPLTYFRKTINSFPVEIIDGVSYHSGHNSFPSGHTMAAFSIFTLLALFSKNKYFQILYFILAFLVGFSRIYLTQHFLDDVLFGSTMGVLLGILTYYLFGEILKKKNSLDIAFKKSKP